MRKKCCKNLKSTVFHTLFCGRPPRGIKSGMRIEEIRFCSIFCRHYPILFFSSSRKTLDSKNGRKQIALITRRIRMSVQRIT